jgi:hypothetical protein
LNASRGKYILLSQALNLEKTEILKIDYPSKIWETTLLIVDSFVSPHNYFAQEI